MNHIDKRIMKLYTLSIRGIDGEAVAAKNRLDELLRKYNITIESILREEPEEREFPTRPKADAQLCSQIVYMVLGKSGKCGGYKGNPNRFCETTDAEYIEISELLDFHKKLMKKELKGLLEKFRRAYYHKHHIFPKTEEDEESPSNLSFEEQMEIIGMANSLSGETYRKKLNQVSLQPGER